MRILVTGGAGFIGSALCRFLVEETNNRVLTIDKLTYAGNLASLASVFGHPRFDFLQIDICDRERLAGAFSAFEPDAVLHLAAESHVDRSIESSEAFIQTNIYGTFQLLEAARTYLARLGSISASSFRFVHVSTDEVFGSLGEEGFFDEASPYDPSSPYSASKAASDHLGRAWHRTYGVPVIITNCSNNFGPYHYPEKLIPLMIIKALRGEPLPVYGDGRQVRDWLHVEDHVRALYLILRRGQPGARYAIGGDGERGNLAVVHAICDLLDELVPGNRPRRQLIQHVRDRAGHDRRYAIDSSRLRQELGWSPRETFASGLLATVSWYLDNQNWWLPILSKQRLGQGPCEPAAKQRPVRAKIDLFETANWLVSRHAAARYMAQGVEAA